VIAIGGLNAFEHGGNIYNAVRRGSNVANILDFSANINPLGLSDSLRQSLLANLDRITAYPDADAHDLKTAISRYYDVDRRSITAGNGAVELLYVLCNTVRPRQVLVPAPTFSEYERAARSSGSEVKHLYLNSQNDFQINIYNLIYEIQTNPVDILFIGNPNNPTGTIMKTQELEPIIRAAQLRNTFVVVDESFLDFLVDDTHYTCRRLLPLYQNLIILHSLTKFYAIPGLRLGFALASPKLTNLMHKGKDPWNVNSLAQCAGVAALADHDFRRTTKQLINQAKDDFYDQIKLISSLRPYQPSVNFILVDISNTKMKSYQLRTQLAQQDILIRDCSNYPGLSDCYIRLAVKKPDQNNHLLRALQNICR
jgi:threonine-phosphate decarboxylase